MKKMRLSLQIAATYIGTIVGAGFASGKEIVQFFTRYGSWGSIGILIACGLFIWVGTKILLLSNRIKAHSLNDLFRYLLGERIGTILQWLMFVMLFGITSVMLAGAGAVFHEQLGLPSFWGRLLICVLCYLLLLRGLNGLLWMNSVVVPILCIFIITLWFATVPFSHALPQAGSGIPHTSLFFSVLQAVAYAAFNLVTAFVVLAPLGSGTDDRRTVLWGGLLGGIGFSLLLILTHMILSRYPALLSHDIPLAELVKRGLPLWFHFLFVMVIYGEIFSTFIGNLFGMIRQIENTDEFGVKSPAPSKTLILLMMGIAFFISQLGYSALIQVLYPLYGYLCLLILLYVIARRD